MYTGWGAACAETASVRRRGPGPGRQWQADREERGRTCAACMVQQVQTRERGPATLSLPSLSLSLCKTHRDIDRCVWRSAVQLSTVPAPSSRGPAATCIGEEGGKGRSVSECEWLSRSRGSFCGWTAASRDGMRSRGRGAVALHSSSSPPSSSFRSLSLSLLGLRRGTPRQPPTPWAFAPASF